MKAMPVEEAEAAHDLLYSGKKTLKKASVYFISVLPFFV